MSFRPRKSTTQSMDAKADELFRPLGLSLQEASDLASGPGGYHLMRKTEVVPGTTEVDGRGEAATTILTHARENKVYRRLLTESLADVESLAIFLDARGHAFMSKPTPSQQLRADLDDIVRTVYGGDIPLASLLTEASREARGSALKPEL